MNNENIHVYKWFSRESNTWYSIALGMIDYFQSVNNVKTIFLSSYNHVRNKTFFSYDKLHKKGTLE